MAEKFKMVGMIVVMVTLYYVVTLALRPCIVVENDANILYCFKLNADEEIALQYVHSVEKTVVIEKIGLVNNELCIKEMLYQSFGAGLPFLVQQGQFRIENDWFIINDINEKESKHIVTIENPVEFRHKDIKALITHREVGEKSDTKSFSDGIRAAMRQDPDIILVG